MIDFENQEAMREWASERLGGLDFSPCMCIGFKKNGYYICVVVYNNFRASPDDVPISIEISIASIDRSWCTRHNLHVIAAYPFIQLKVKRVQATVAKRNKHTRKFLVSSGFKYEGLQRQGWVFGGDATVYSLLNTECRWLQNVPERP
jgi:RimJ/RimL family protein N-acetyltransferase